LAVGAVSIEPVSTANFPGNRENNRDIQNSSPFSGFKGLKNPDVIGPFAPNSLGQETGNIFAGTANFGGLSANLERGVGYVREFQVNEDCVLTLRGSGHRSASWGLAGGAGPAISRTWINPGTPGELSLPAIKTRQLKAGDILRVERSGGGGYGSPLERPVEALRQDIENGYVSLDKAREQYGLVLDQPTLAVNQIATRARRIGFPSGSADA
jgi:hypothetical protein